MNQTITRLVPFICTLVLLSLGLSLPHLTGLVLDRQLEQELVEQENRSFSLNLAQGNFLQALSLFGWNDRPVRLSTGNQMREEEVVAAATAVYEALPTAGLEGASLVVSPVLFTSWDRSSDLSAVFWLCIWTFPDGNEEILWLDDQWGQPVAFGLRMAPDALLADWNKETPTAVSQLVEYLRLHYPVDDVILKEGTWDPYEGYTLVPADSYFTYNADYYITLWRIQSDEKVRTVLPLSLQEEWMYFNVQ